MIHLLYCLVFLIAAHCHAESDFAHFDRPKEVVVAVNEATIFCRTMGTGSPLIVVHGGPGLSQDYLLPYLYKLAENHFVIFYDQRGCGQSTGEISPKNINNETFIRDLEGIRKAFAFDKVSLLGHSWGGLLALEYAISYPQHVNKLIVSNSAPASAEDFSLLVQEYIRRTAPFQKELDAIRNSSGFRTGDPQTMERWYRLIFRTYCYFPEKANLLNLKMTSSASLNGVKVEAVFDADPFFKNYNVLNSLKTVRVPTLIVQGDSDIIPYSTARHIHESIEGSEFVLMKNCGHFPYVEDPSVYFSILNTFLNEKGCE